METLGNPDRVTPDPPEMETSDNFCLRWNENGFNMIGSFEELRQSNELLDVTLCCDNGVDVMQAHKAVLAAYSPFFRRLFQHTNNSQNPFLYLKGVTKETLTSVLNFMYQGEVNLTQDAINSFLSAAEELAIKGLTASETLKDALNSFLSVAEDQSIEGLSTSESPKDAPNKAISVAEDQCIASLSTSENPNDNILSVAEDQSMEGLSTSESPKARKDSSETYNFTSTETILTGLMLACMENNAGAAKILIDRGAKIDAVDENGWTALHHAANNGAKECIELLIKEKANLKAESNSGKTPLVLAIYNGHIDVVEILLNGDKMEKPSGTYSLRMAETYDETTEFDEEAKTKNEYEKHMENKAIFAHPLHLASYCGQTRAAELLLANGAQVDLQDEDGYSALHWAASSGHTETAQFLIEKGADVNLLSTDDTSPLYLATLKNNFDTVEFLMKKGALINQVNNEGETPLHGAAACGDFEAVKLLVNKGAMINPQNNYGYTPLFMASFEDHIEIIEFLLKKGARTDLPDEDGKTVIDCLHLFEHETSHLLYQYSKK